MLFYPGISMMGPDPSEFLKNLTDGMRAFLLISTIVFQWAIFGLNYLAVYWESTGLAGLGLRKPRMIHVAWGLAFWLAAIAILSGLGWLLAQVGLELPGEVGMLIPTDTFGRILWVLVSITAGFCEEVAFRGYLMTRLRLLLKTDSWVLPTIVSAVIFGVCHTYQGMAGFILISIYGVMFSLLYIRTGSLWPGIIAHFLQDFMYLFVPLDV
ncbi:CPBP family intramembrane metalloprotease [candidate division GN15 bacterium]|nr:CPBP family intramembrane metalloprotease [candidate division GN15 bacterium]